MVADPSPPAVPQPAETERPSHNEQALDNRSSGEPKKPADQRIMANKKVTPASEQAEGTGKAAKPPAISRKAFLAAAKALTVTIDGFPMGAEVKEFSTGSYGWNINGKASIKVGDVAVPVQIGMNLTVVNSKNDPK